MITKSIYFYNVWLAINKCYCFLSLSLGQDVAERRIKCKLSEVLKSPLVAVKCDVSICNMALVGSNT